MSASALAGRPHGRVAGQTSEGVSDVNAAETPSRLEVRSLHFAYDHQVVLTDLDFQVTAGELCALLGNNGVGKSTLLKCLLGILKPQEGRVLLDGRDTASLDRLQVARRMAYVAQQVSSVERLTVFDVVLMGRRPHITWAVRDRDLQVVHEVIEQLGLEAFVLRPIDRLSGGELQKVLIARALAQGPSVLVLDEPTSNLDLRNQLEVMRTVRHAVEQRGIAALMAIHDINLALRFATHFILLKEGGILANGGPEIITPESIRETYGVPASVERVDGHMMVIPEG